jgi:hypothetical protein
MKTIKLQEEQSRYWNGNAQFQYQSGLPKIVIYGDSQAFDIFSALKNNSLVGLKYFAHSFKCSAFFSPNFGMDATQAVCRDYFDKPLNSDELRSADYLVYAHEWEKAYEQTQNYALAIEELRKVNPKIQIIFFGPKPYIGVGQTMNNLLRNRSTLSVNTYLNNIKRIDQKNNQYVQELSKNLGVKFIDINNLFCDQLCPFFIDNQFTYFDSNHWMLEGGKIFYERLAKTADFKGLMQRENP